MGIIKADDTFMDALIKMGNGNPGALTALMEVMNEIEAIDPDNALGAVGVLLHLDSLEIYGTDIYVLWSDICERSNVRMIAVLRAVQLGIFPYEKLKDACGRQDYSGKELVPVEELLSKVQTALPNFRR
jgi:hypothetical protein